MLKKNLFPTLLVAALAFGTVACSSTQPVGEQIDDAVITSKIEAKMAADTQVSAFNVGVDTQDGVVRLSGTVKHPEARREAEEIARSTKGVRRVVNEIEVGDRSMGDRLDDAGITAKVKSKLAADPEINPFNIDVDTKDGVVTLSGRVASGENKREAGELARSTKGVRDVRNMLKVGDHREESGD